jgi:hypothetical protein
LLIGSSRWNTVGFSLWWLLLGPKVTKLIKRLRTCCFQFQKSLRLKYQSEVPNTLFKNDFAPKIWLWLLWITIYNNKVEYLWLQRNSNSASKSWRGTYFQQVDTKLSKYPLTVHILIISVFTVLFTLLFLKSKRIASLLLSIANINVSPFSERHNGVKWET